MLHQVSLSDWISLAIGLIGVAAALLSRWGRLPANVRRWLKAIGQKRVLSLIETAAGDLSKKTNEQKRDWVATQVQAIAVKKVGFHVPDSIANLLVEHGYQIYKNATAKRAK